MVSHELLEIKDSHHSFFNVKPLFNILAENRIQKWDLYIVINIITMYKYYNYINYNYIYRTYM